MEKIKTILLYIFVIFIVALSFTNAATAKKRSAPILMYHGVGIQDDKSWGNMLISPEVFEEHIKCLVDNGWKVVSVEELSERFRKNKNVEKYVAITFDDGYVNNYLYAFPILKKYNARATFYLICDRIGTDGYMDDCQINEMLGCGMRIGSHTITHCKLTLVDEEQAKREIADSKILLEQRFKTTRIESISYPHGRYNDKIMGYARECGYLEGVTGEPAVNTRKSFDKNPFALFRIDIYDGMNFELLVK